MLVVGTHGEAMREPLGACGHTEAIETETREEVEGEVEVSADGGTRCVSRYRSLDRHGAVECGV
jgi:hypothetical protein